MTFGEDWGWGASKEESNKTVRPLRRGGATSSIPPSTIPTAPARSIPASL